MTDEPADISAALGEPSHAELVDFLRLAMISGVGPRLRQALLECFGTPGEVLRAAPSRLRDVLGVGPTLSRRIAAAQEEIDAEQVIAECRQHGIAIVTERHGSYPRALREVADPPGVLFIRGQIEPRDALAVAIVGTRHATHYGIAQAERLADGLARAGLTVVSGLARGIDAAAHRACLAAGGRTLAVLASGVMNIYPPEHDALADQVAGGGAVLSEAPPLAEPLAGMFPQRNRIISGLSLGVLVIEAGQRSGALITARHAMEQGRDVFALPGRVDNRMAEGCHRLIRDGAMLVQSVDDILEGLGHLVEAAPRADGQMTHHPAEVLLNEVEQRILAAFQKEPTSIDQVVATTGLPVSQVLSTLSVLEMRRLVRRISGSLAVRL